MNAIDVGDRGVAVLVTAADPAARCAEVRGLAAGLAAAGIGGVTDVVPSPGRVTVVYDPLQIGHAAVRDRIGRIVTATRDSPPPAPEMRHELPVCYGGEHGPDLAEVCLRHGIDERTFVALHTGPDYTVEAIGFLPGFGYLAGLPERLATPRRATPRRVVPAGSVGIGGRHTAAYPAASPGGWNLVGATPTPLFDASRPRPATLGAGDRVRFTAIDAGQFARLRREVDAGPAWSSGAGITVLTPGLATTIQDLGRPGHRAEGVPLSGAADTVSLRLANRLVGNPATAAGLEITLLGPTLRFDRSALVAVAGAEFPGVPHGRAVRVAAGDTIAFGHATSGCRGYLAVAGGIDVPRVLGSRSTCVAARLGGIRGLPLAAGDALPVGEAGLGRIATPAAGRIAIDEAAATGVTLRVIAGEQWALVGDRLWSTTHVATSRSDRMGVRLDGPPLATEPVRGDLPSVAVLPGAIQLPPDGAPIILLADAQTIGGYPVIGHVIAADLPLVAQLRPGAAVRWRHATIAEAHAALTQLEARLLGGEA